MSLSVIVVLQSLSLVR